MGGVLTWGACIELATADDDGFELESQSHDSIQAEAEG